MLALSRGLGGRTVQRDLSGAIDDFRRDGQGVRLRAAPEAGPPQGAIDRGAVIG